MKIYIIIYDYRKENIMSYKHQVIAEYVQQRPVIAKLCHVIEFWGAWLIAVFWIVGIQPVMAVIGNIPIYLLVGSDATNWGIAAVCGDLLLFALYALGALSFIMG
jgi:hypothetical protein